MIYVYGDMSGTKHTAAYAAACYIGTDKQWEAVDRKWAKALADAKVDYFHATRFFACQGPFKAWKKGSPHHAATEKRFTTIAQSERLIGFAYGIETAGWDEEFRAVIDLIQNKYRLRSIRLFCVEQVLQRIARFIQRNPLPKHERIIAVFEDEKGIGEVLSHFKLAKRANATWTRGFIDVIARKKKEVRPLQVADLLAHEAYKVLSMPSGTPGRPSLGRMLHEGRLQIDRSTAAELKASIPEIRAFLEKFPDALPKLPSGPRRVA